MFYEYFFLFVLCVCVCFLFRVYVLPTVHPVYSTLYLSSTCRTNETGGWGWSMLPALPWPLSSAGVASVGSKLYVFGGADYDPKGFYTFTNRSGGNPGLGKHLLMLDTANTAAGSVCVDACMGTWMHVYVHVCARVGAGVMGAWMHVCARVRTLNTTVTCMLLCCNCTRLDSTTRCTWITTMGACFQPSRDQALCYWWRNKQWVNCSRQLGV